MIRKGDVQWWVLEARKSPESAPALIEELAERLVELDAENENLRDEIIRLQRRTSTMPEDSEAVSELRRKVAMLQGLLDGEAADEPAVTLVSERLDAARVPIPKARRLSREGTALLGGQSSLRVRSILLTRPHEELLLLSNQARGFKITASDIPLLIDEGEWPSFNGPQIAKGEWLTAAVTAGQPPRFWTLVTRRGFVQQCIRIGLDRDIEAGRQLIESPFRRDAPVAIVNGDQGDLLIVTRWGKYVRFPQRAIPQNGAPAIELDPDDEIVAALPLARETEILVATASGHVMRRETAQLSAHSKPGQAGRTLIQAFDALAAFPFDPQGQLVYLTYSGRLTLIPAEQIPLHLRAGKGNQMRDLDRDPAVAATLIPGTL
jgi:DNA gyrase/topoisomerase IV subunit A